MTQINIRIDPEDDELLTYLAKQKKVSKTVIARDFLLSSLGQNIFPILLEDYRMGKIGLKKLIKFSRLSPQEVLRKIADAKIEPPISESLDDYTSDVRESLVNDLKKGNVLMKKTPPKRKPEKPLTEDEISQ
jgi:hypothetical protein